MKEREFRLWMEKTNHDYHTARTYAARCYRIEAGMNIDLDEEYKKDQGASLIQSLKYSRAEANNKLLPRCGITFDDDANVYTGMSAIRVSVKKYFEFIKQSES